MGWLAGLIAALAWTLASSLWRGLATSLTALQLNGLKNGIACLLLLPVLLTLPWMHQPASLVLLLLSGGVGIALGDSFLSRRPAPSRHPPHPHGGFPGHRSLPPSAG
jgi:hypothetical protein